jgi:5-formyltetrahydrofolate cyclo-ligase
MIKVFEKELIRKRLLERLLSLTSREVERRSRDVEKNLQKLPDYNKAKCIMVYYPLKGEVNLLGMIRKELKEKLICFPSIEGRELVPYQVKNLEEDFITGLLGVKQPNPQRTKKVRIEDLDLILVPGLAFDFERNRLGRGAGFYDRLLKRLNKNIKTIGIAFNFQVLKNLPYHSPQDQKVDILVTDTFSL